MLLYQAGEQSELEDAVTRLPGRWSLAAGRMELGDGVVLHEMIRRLVADRLRSEDALPKAIADAADLLDRATFMARSRPGTAGARVTSWIAHIAALSTSAGFGVRPRCRPR